MEQQTEEPIFSLPNVRSVPEWALGKVLIKVEAINAKATKLGLPAFEIHKGAPYPVEKETESGHKYFVEYVDITVTGAPVQVSGFRFLARIDFEDGATLTNVRPGEVLPVRYRHATTFCDHCASDRRRNSVFVFRRDGGEQHIQVGSNCLKDFLGHDPAAVLWSSRLWAQLCDDIDEECSRGGQEERTIYVDRTLEMTAAIMRLDNGAYRSKAWAQATEYGTSTVSDVLEQLFPPPANCRGKGWVKVEPTAEDVARAADALAWGRSTLCAKPEEQRSDYEHNLATLIERDLVRIKRAGIVCSLMSAYARHLGDLATRAKAVDAYVGKPKERRRFDATLLGVSHYDTAYGRTYIGRFATPEGVLVYMGASPFWPGDLEVGGEISFVATIKEHAEYRGLKQTIIQRAKLEELAAA